MNTLTFILVACLLWFSYVMYDSYTGMQRELREIRLKCIGTPNSKYTSPSVGTIAKDGIIETLKNLAKMAE